MRGPKPTARPKVGHRNPAGAVVKMPMMPVALCAEIPPPTSLPEAVYAAWSEVVAELQRSNTLHATDLLVVEQLVMALYRAREARAVIAETSPLLDGQRGLAAHPLLKVERDSTIAYLRLAEACGLTPASRLRSGLNHLVGRTLAEVIASRMGD